MPRRSNEFQKLVFSVYKQLSDKGTVTESKMLVNRVTGVEREVDIVIESPVADQIITISIEVIDRSRPAGLQWIDEMRGKHENLPTDKLVLVSKFGFVKDAFKEAEKHGIDLKNFNNAIQADWTLIVNKLKEVFFARLDLTPTECKATLSEVSQMLENPNLSPDLVLYDSQNQPLGNIRAIVQNKLKERWIFETIYKREDRMDITTFELKFPVQEGCYVLDNNSTQRKLQALSVKGTCKFTINEVPLDHHSYGKAQISYGKTKIKEGDMLLTIVEQDDGNKTCEITKLP